VERERHQFEKTSFSCLKNGNKAKMKGGIGVIKLRVQNDALLLKNLHMFFNKADLPWVHLIWNKYYSNGKLPGQTMKYSFWWRSMLRLLNLYKGISHAQAKSGESILFWKDVWNGRILYLSYPHVFSFAIEENATLQSVLAQDSL
jgi:hypothetical protein